MPFQRLLLLQSEFLLMSVRQKPTDAVDMFPFILYLQIDNLPDVKLLGSEIQLWPYTHKYMLHLYLQHKALQ